MENETVPVSWLVDILNKKVSEEEAEVRSYTQQRFAEELKDGREDLEDLMAYEPGGLHENQCYEMGLLDGMRLLKDALFIHIEGRKQLDEKQSKENK